MKPNILLIVVDCLTTDQAFDRNISKPTLEKLRSEGVSFNNAITSSTTTTPSFTSMLTGLFPPKHGMRGLYGYKLKDSVTSLVESLKENGYSTYGEFTGPLLELLGLSKGFDVYHLRDKKDGVNSKWYAELKDKIKNKKLKEPWFLMVHFWEMHLPRRFPKEFNKKEYGRNRYEKTLSFFDSRLKELIDVVDTSDTIISLTSDHGEAFGKNKLDEIKFSMIKLKNKVKEILGLDVDTLTQIGHGFHVHEYLVKVPLIISGYKLPKKLELKNQVRSIDILPTALDYAGVKNKFSIDGVSLKPLIEGKSTKPLIAYSESCGEVLRGDYSKRFSSVRTDNYKYIVAPYAKDKQEKLYDIQNDPLEQNNIILTNKDKADELRYMFKKIFVYEKEKIKKMNIIR